jgi:hypothetical protein
MTDLNELYKAVTGQDSTTAPVVDRKPSKQDIDVARAIGNWDSGYPAIQNPDVDQNGFPKRDLHA